MTTWTVDKPLTGRYGPNVSYRVDAGGRGIYGGFDYVVNPDAACDAVDVVGGSDGEAVRRWLPIIRDGVLAAVEELWSRNENVRGVRIRISAVHVHPVDTTTQVMWRAGSGFLRDVILGLGRSRPKRTSI